MRVLNEWRYSFFPWTCNECLFVLDTVHSSWDTKVSNQCTSPCLLEALEELIVITSGTNTGWWQLAEFFCFLGGSVHLLWEMRLWDPKIILLCAHLLLHALPHASTQISLCPSSNLPLSMLLTSGQAIHHCPTGLVYILPDVTSLYSHRQPSALPIRRICLSVFHLSEVVVSCHLLLACTWVLSQSTHIPS